MALHDVRRGKEPPVPEPYPMPKPVPPFPGPPQPPISPGQLPSRGSIGRGPMPIVGDAPGQAGPYDMPIGPMGGPVGMQKTMPAGMPAPNDFNAGAVMTSPLQQLLRDRLLRGARRPPDFMGPPIQGF